MVCILLRLQVWLHCGASDSGCRVVVGIRYEGVPTDWSTGVHILFEARVCRAELFFELLCCAHTSHTRLTGTLKFSAAQCTRAPQLDLIGAQAHRVRNDDDDDGELSQGGCLMRAALDGGLLAVLCSRFSGAAAACDARW